MVESVISYASFQTKMIKKEKNAPDKEPVAKEPVAEESMDEDEKYEKTLEVISTFFQASFFYIFQAFCTQF